MTYRKWQRQQLLLLLLISAIQSIELNDSDRYTLIEADRGMD